MHIHLIHSFILYCSCQNVFTMFLCQQKNPNKYDLYSFETLWPDGGRNDLKFSCGVQCWHAKCDHNNASLSNLFTERSLVGSFKHLPHSRGRQITAYICMQLANKSSSLILCIIHVSSQLISLSFWMVKMFKIQRENILKRPIQYLWTFSQRMNVSQYNTPAQKCPLNI